MKKNVLPILLALAIPLFVSMTGTYEFGQVASDTTDTTQVVGEDGEELQESSNLWSLIGEAGPIRYPIFAILIIGLFLISLKMFELYRDKNKSSNLMSVPFPDLNLKQMVRTLERQTDHMLSRVMAKQLNVFQTKNNADYLHDEISNYNAQQQKNYNSFKNRIDFLSDTAGALGLLGTVVGMFKVFSSGSLEKETILAGMGLALMSTLLGLIVSIVLNFASTITDGFFSKHLDKVTNKADEMRFRLIELSDDPESTDAPPTRTTLNSAGNQLISNSKPSVEPDTRRPENKKGQNNSSPKKDDKPENKPAEFVLKKGLNETYTAGEKIETINIQLMGTSGEPIVNEAVEVVLMHAGKIDDKTGNKSFKTNEDGTITFNWTLHKKTGTQKAGIRIASKEHRNVRKELSVKVKAAEPATLKILNNHQAVETGKPLKKPIVAVVNDKFDNPVNDISISMKVSMGNGTFENGKKTFNKKTNQDGRVEIGFTLGDEPGFNAVDVDLDNYKISKKFQAVGQEVTA